MNRRVHGVHMVSRRAWRAVLAAGAFAAAAWSCSEPAAVDVEVATVTVAPKTTTVRAGATVALTVQAADAAGAPLTPRGVRWSSNEPSVALVSSSGVVTGVSAGTARIAVSAMGHSDVATVTVTSRPVASVLIAPSQSAVLVGRTATLRADPRDVDGNVLPGRVVTWTSSDTRIVTVSSDGVATGVAPGVANVVAACEGQTAQAVVVVSLPAVQTVTVAPTRDTLQVGTSRTLVPTLRDGTGAVLTGRTLSWSSSNVAVAIVSAAGVVTALAPGTVTVTAVSEGRAGTATIVVIAPLVGTITLSPSTSTLVVGTTLALQSQITDAFGNVLTGRPISYTSEAPAIATVSATGVVSAIAPGDARIVATSEGKTGAATVRVIAVPVASVQLSPATGLVNTGQTLALSVVTRAADGTVLTGRQVNWQSGAPAVATVSSSGVVTGVAPGVAAILATVDGVTAISTVTVRLPPVAQIVLSPLNGAIDMGAALQLTAVLRDAAGTTLTGRTVVWTSSNEQVAFVNSTGLVVGFRIGTATITITSEGISASTTVTVR